MAECMKCRHGSVCEGFQGEHSKDCEFFLPESDWISVKESLPEKKGEYLVAYYSCWWDDVKYDKRFVSIDTFRGKTTWAKRKFQRVTHWMPLPEPPQDGGEEDRHD